jgi:hypothetical protein
MNLTPGPPPDPFEKASDDELLGNRSFHAFMAYGIVYQASNAPQHFPSPLFRDLEGLQDSYSSET